jgi:hypothetical protein
MRRTTFIAAILLALPLFAQSERRAADQTFASDRQTVPVMANAAGVGGTFQTYVALLNPTSSSYPITVTLYDAAGQKHTGTITLAAGEQRTYANFLDSLFQYSGAGAVTFESGASLGGAHNNRFIVNVEARTAANRTGTAIPVLDFAGSSSPSFSPGVTVDSNTRTNIGCFDQSGAANLVTATVLDSTGAQTIGSINLQLAPNGWLQAPVTSFVSGGYVRFAPADSAVCYAVVVDNATNVGRFISSAEYTP